jgi:hypothetical protein
VSKEQMHGKLVKTKTKQSNEKGLGCRDGCMLACVAREEMMGCILTSRNYAVAMLAQLE